MYKASVNHTMHVCVATDKSSGLEGAFNKEEATVTQNLTFV